MPANTARSPRARGLLQVSWSVSDDRLNVTWDETEGPPVENVGPAGFGTRLLQVGAHARSTAGPTSAILEDRRTLHDAMPHTAGVKCFERPG